MQQNNLKEAALEYLRKGYPVIPVGLNKEPLIKWRPYQTQLPTENEVTEWFSNPNAMGIAILTGKLSGLVVLDIDEVDADLSDLEIPETWTAKTGRGGRHYYFKHPSYDIKNRTKINGRLFDLRGDGGYIIAPPSVSFKGTYEWIIGLDHDLAEVPKWLEPKPESSSSKDKTSPVADNQNWDIASGTSEGNRHDSAVRLAGKLLSHIPKKDRDSIVWPLLKAWNKTNQPPMSDTELKSVYTSLKRRHEAGEAVDVPPPAPRELITLKDLLSEEPATQPFLINPFIPHQGISALGGQPNTGKSWIMLEIARAVASGKPLFGEFESLQGNVLIVDEENGKNEMYRRLKKLDFPDDLPIFFHIYGGLKVDRETDLEQLISVIKEKQISLVIFDPYVAMHNKSENNAEETSLVMEALQKLILAGTAVFFVHHLRKDSIAKFGQAQSLRGSSALLGRLDSLIIAKQMNRGDDPTQDIQISHDKARRGMRNKPFRVSFVELDGKMTASKPVEVEAKRLKIEEARDAILDLLKEQELSRKEIITALTTSLNIGGKNISDALRSLVSDGNISESKKGKENVYRIAPETEEGML